jgi:hypothetical protein
MDISLAMRSSCSCFITTTRLALTTRMAAVASGTRKTFSHDNTRSPTDGRGPSRAAAAILRSSSADGVSRAACL